MKENTIKAQMRDLPKIAAIDFDGTLVEDKYPDLGGFYIEVVKRIVWLRQQEGYKLILWTCRTGKKLEEAVAYCKKYDIEFDAVNDNIIEVKSLFGENTRKIYADFYLDDKNLLITDFVKVGTLNETLNREVKSNWVPNLHQKYFYPQICKGFEYGVATNEMTVADIKHIEDGECYETKEGAINAVKRRGV